LHCFRDITTYFPKLGHVALSGSRDPDHVPVRVICCQYAATWYSLHACRKFNHSSRFGDIIGAHQNVNGTHDLTTLLSGVISHPWANALAAVNLPTKFDVSNSTHYEDMKGNTKCRNGVVKGSYGSYKATGNSTIR